MLIATIILHPNTAVIAVLVGMVLPLLTGVVTKLGSSSAVKAVTNAVLSVVAGLITNLTVNPTIDVYTDLYAIALAFISSTAAYFSLWVPFKNLPLKIQTKTANFGIGSSSSAPADI